MKTRILISAVATGVFLIACRQQAQSQSQRLEKIEIEVSENWMRDASLREIQDATERARQLRPYEKVTRALGILPILLRQDTIELKGYTWKANTHDLRRQSGRAARIMEELTGQKLPPVLLSSGPAELKAIHSKAEVALNDFTAELIAATKKKQTQQTIEELERKYLGDFARGFDGSDVGMARKAFDSLFDEWFPVGQPVGDLEKIIGREGKKMENGISYTFFSNDWGGVYIGIVVEKGIIIAVIVKGFS